MGVVHTGNSHIASGKFGVDSSQYSFKFEVNGNSHLGTNSYVSSGGYHIDGGAYWRWQRDTGNNRLKLTRGDNLAEAVCVTTSNYMGIGTTSPSYKLEVAGTFYSSGSSAIYKQDVQDYKPNTDAIMNLRPVNYEYTDEYKHFGKRLENNSPQIGLVAEEVAKVMPELAVMKEEDGKEVVRNVDYEKLTVVLLSEVQELKKELKALKEGI